MLWGVLLLGLAGVVAAYFLEDKGPRYPVISTAHEFTLTNQLGQAVGARDLRGQVWVANVIFSRCPTQCRRLSAQMEAVQSRIPRRARSALQDQHGGQGRQQDGSDRKGDHPLANSPNAPCRRAVF